MDGASEATAARDTCGALGLDLRQSLELARTHPDPVSKDGEISRSDEAWMARRDGARWMILGMFVNSLYNAVHR